MTREEAQNFMDGIDSLVTLAERIKDGPEGVKFAELDGTMLIDYGELIAEALGLHTEYFDFGNSTERIEFEYKGRVYRSYSMKGF